MTAELALFWYVVVTFSALAFILGMGVQNYKAKTPTIPRR